MYRVPRCGECNRRKGIRGVVGYTEYYCYRDAYSNGYGETVGSLGVDHPPKTSPKWCPLRKKRSGKE